jgi:hypothetical protein
VIGDTGYVECGMTEWGMGYRTRRHYSQTTIRREFD